MNMEHTNETTTGVSMDLDTAALGASHGIHEEGFPGHGGRTSRRGGEEGSPGRGARWMDGRCKST